MAPDLLIPISLFLAIFGVIYLFLSTRNKERLALIEKGADASIFMKGRQNGIPTGRIIILNLASWELALAFSLRFCYLPILPYTRMPFILQPYLLWPALDYL
jgi:hypothetical protein